LLLLLLLFARWVGDIGWGLVTRVPAGYEGRLLLGCKVAKWDWGPGGRDDVAQTGGFVACVVEVAGWLLSVPSEGGAGAAESRIDASGCINGEVIGANVVALLLVLVVVVEVVL
jgi:hypothetical protein